MEMSQTQNTTHAQVFTIASKPHVGKYITEYPTQTGDTNPNGIAVDSNGNVWFVLGNISTLSELTPSNGTIHEYSIPGSGTYTSLCWGMVYQDSKNMIWFTDDNTNAVYSFSESTSIFTKYSLQDSLSTPFGIAIDNQGNVWFAEAGSNRLGEVSSTGQSERDRHSCVSWLTSWGYSGSSLELSGSLFPT